MLSRSCSFCAVLLIFTSLCAFAAENNNVISFKPEIQRGDLNNPQGLWPFLGVGLGTMNSTDTIRTGGVPMHIKVLGSYYFEQAPWVADFGLGLHNEFLNQDGEGSDTIQSLYSELAARYELTNRWQLGAIWNTLIDNPDRYSSNTENMASFMGLQVLKEFNWKDEYIVRAGGRAMTDVGISGEAINTVMAELEVSFGSGHPAPIAQVEEPVQRVEPVVEVAPHLNTRAMQVFEIDPKHMNFESDSTKLTAGSHSYMRRLARVLAANNHLFDSVEVIGHTDQRGTNKYNDMLSLRRAQTIQHSLTSAGLSQRQLRTVARGENNLLTNSMAPQALQRNRRVQLEFQGVKNSQALKSLIDSVAR